MAGLLGPKHTAARLIVTHVYYIPQQPTEADFVALVEEFWWETTYVAKNLWRDELFAAKYSFDAVIKFDLLRRMLEWYVEIEHGWTVSPGSLGRRLKTRIPSRLWNQVEQTFVGANIEQNWDALFKTAELFRNIATIVAADLGYASPESLDRRMMHYLATIRALER